ncbi:hypothetical protein LWM68_30600 [Niabella sp. W65]|nr:hypothetical protein [Niabella sp. W65]MCH7366727.1 hypothetical protein [Niabella sp. W65]ULT42429.1 hypothetical protein KRR40_02110 [Niabella sp. I65]
MEELLQNEIDQSVAVRKGAPVGTYIAYVQFIIMPDGKVGEVRALSKNGFGMEEELVRVIKNQKHGYLPLKTGERLRHIGNSL